MEKVGLIKTVLNPILRHSLTAAGVWLVGNGYLDADQSNNFVTIGIGLAAGGVGAIWSLINNRSDAKKLAASGREKTA